MSASRKLKAEGSNPEAPERKNARAHEQDAEVAGMQVDESAPGWAQHMQKMLIAVMGKVDGTAKEINEAMKLAQEAKDEATEAKEVVATVAADVADMKREMQPAMQRVADLETEFKTYQTRAQQKPAMNWPPVASASASQGAKERNNDNDDNEGEKRRRTLGFGQFPKDTKAEDIVKFLEGVLEEAKGDIEEVFAYGKKFAERGAARFITSEAMWAYLKGKAGKTTHMYQGQKIYCNTDTKSTDMKRDRAVRKLVRTIIEAEGGDGDTVKQHIDTNYKKGVVWFKELRVGEWKNGAMHLSGHALQYQDRFTELYAAE
jgi:hypothetical protein